VVEALEYLLIITNVCKGVSSLFSSNQEGGYIFFFVSLCLSSLIRSSRNRSYWFCWG